MLKMRIERANPIDRTSSFPRGIWKVWVNDGRQIYLKPFASRRLAREYVATMRRAHAPDQGYDGVPIKVGDRIELSPSTDLWMRGARFGTVRGISITDADKFRIELDMIPGRLFSCASETLRWRKA